MLRRPRRHATRVYEWDYARQILELRILDAAGGVDRATARQELYSDAFLIKRPLLQAIDPGRTRPAVLLIDEIDRADEEFEGYLLELLSEFQITIPELGTVRAAHPPLVILTSNRTRDVHDALKRRCLYQWIDYPPFDKETRHRPASACRTRRRGSPRRSPRSCSSCGSTSSTRFPASRKRIDWVAALAALDRDDARRRIRAGHDRRAAESRRKTSTRFAAACWPN